MVNLGEYIYIYKNMDKIYKSAEKNTAQGTFEVQVSSAVHRSPKDLVKHPWGYGEVPEQDEER